MGNKKRGRLVSRDQRYIISSFCINSIFNTHFPPFPFLQVTESKERERKQVTESKERERKQVTESKERERKQVTESREKLRTTKF